MKMHPSLTRKKIMAAVVRSHRGVDYPGFCVNCGAAHDGIEPDAQHYRCDECEHDQVFGAEELSFFII
jgi:hypothetical protein